MERLLYKIMPLDEKRLTSIENGKLWFSKARTFNDPYDCAIEPYLDAGLEESELDRLVTNVENISPLFAFPRTAAYCAGDKKVKNQEIYKFVTERLSQVAVCSFLSDPLNIVTWSHYGNQHKGICLEFSMNDTMMSYARGFHRHNVNYSNEMPFCRWKDFLSAPEFIVNLMLTTKYTDWAYEKEQRIIAHQVAGGQAIDLDKIGLQLTKIYLGSRFQVDTSKTALFDRLQCFCEANDIPLVGLQRHRYSYQLSEVSDPAEE